MNHSVSGPPGDDDHLREAVRELHAVRQSLAASLSPGDWQEAYEGLGRVVIAAIGLAATLMSRCFDPDRAAELRALDRGLRDAIAEMNRAGSAPVFGDPMREQASWSGVGVIELIEQDHREI